MKKSRVFGKSYAKVNLTLDVFTKKAGDEFHELKTIFHRISLCDEMSLEVSDKFEIIGEFSCKLEDNLIYKAFLLIQNYFENCEDKYRDILKPVSVEIKKNIPEKGGLGGGSSNFASFIKLYFELFELGEIPREIIDKSANFGKDIKIFFKDNSCVLGTGFGEKLETLDLNFFGKKIYIYKPEFENSTAEMYKNFKNYNTKFSQEFIAKFGGDLPAVECNNFDLNTLDCGNGFDGFFENKKYQEIFTNFEKKSENFPFIMCGSGSCFFSFEKFELPGVKVFESWLV